MPNPYGRLQAHGFPVAQAPVNPLLTLAPPAPASKNRPNHEIRPGGMFYNHV